MELLIFIRDYWKLLMVGALVAVIGVDQIRIADLKSDASGLKADQAVADAQRQLAARQFQTAISTQRAAAAAQQQENADAFNKVTQERNAARTQLAAAHDRLRLDLSAYIAGNSAGTTAGAPACSSDRDKAVALGNLLLSGDELAQRLAAAAEQRNDEVRLLLEQIQTDRAACAPVSP